MARSTKSTGGKPKRGKSQKQPDSGLRVNDYPPPMSQWAVAPVVLREPKAPPPSPAPEPTPLPKASPPEVGVKQKVHFTADSEGSFIDHVQREYRREKLREYASTALIVMAPGMLAILIIWLI